MSESKHEIPAPMLDAATKAYLDNLLPEKFKADFNGEDHTHRFTAYAQKVAKVMLEAAGVPEMAARIAELEAELGNIADAKSENFDMSGDFVDWARSRARWTLRENPNRIKLKSGESAGGE